MDRSEPTPHLPDVVRMPSETEGGRRCLDAIVGAIHPYLAVKTILLSARACNIVLNEDWHRRFIALFKKVRPGNRDTTSRMLCAFMALMLCAGDYQVNQWSTRVGGPQDIEPMWEALTDMAASGHDPQLCADIQQLLGQRSYRAACRAILEMECDERICVNGFLRWMGLPRDHTDRIDLCAALAVPMSKEA